MLTADRLGVLKSEYFDVLLQIGGQEYRACKVQFRRQEGALATYVYLLPSLARASDGCEKSSSVVRPEDRKR